jgi:hypothetical protein
VTAIEATLRDRAFHNWLLDNWGFEHGHSIKHVPPKFVRPDGMFDVGAYGQWLEARYREWKAQ